MSTFYFIRHGKPDYSESDTKIYQGMGNHMQTLSDEGIRQAQQAVDVFRSKKIDLIVTSPFGRALHTAAILSKELQVDLRVETDIYECCQDRDFVYLPDDEANRSFEEMKKFHAVNPPDKQYNWESIDDMRPRVQAVLNKYNDLEHVIVVCHGCLMEYVLEMDHHPTHCEVVTWET